MNAAFESRNRSAGKDQAAFQGIADEFKTKSLHFTVFGTDWGRHPDSLQQIFLNLSGPATIEWVGSVGMRAPRLTRSDLFRISSRVARTPQSGSSRKSLVLDRLIRPVVLPWHHRSSIRWLNSQLFMPRLRGRLTLPDDGVVVTMYPTADLFARQLPGELRVAYVADDYAEMPGVNAGFLRELEREWIDCSDIVFASAMKLVDRYRGWGHPDVHLLAHGVDVDLFLNSPPGGPATLMDLESPVIGFLGAISQWVDVDLICHLADHFQNATVLLVGPVDIDDVAVRRLRSRPNIILSGPVPFEQVPGTMKRFDVGIIPFARSPLMDSVNPLKLLEYLAAGLPVVSTPMGDVVETEGAVGIATDPASFVRCVAQALDRGSDDSSVSLRLEHAKQRSWAAVASEFESLVRERLEQGRQQSRSH